MHLPLSQHVVVNLVNYNELEGVTSSHSLLNTLLYRNRQQGIKARVLIGQISVGLALALDRTHPKIFHCITALRGK